MSDNGKVHVDVASEIERAAEIKRAQIEEENIANEKAKRKSKNYAIAYRLIILGGVILLWNGEKLGLPVIFIGIMMYVVKKW